MKGLKLYGLISGWLIIIVLGMLYLVNYSYVSDQKLFAPALWPANSKIERTNSQLSLVMFVHPYCACSLASIHELSKVMTTVGQYFPKTFIVFYKPGQDVEAWKSSPLWKEVNQLKSLNIVLDNQGFESENFNAEISGFTMLYSSEGKLLFSGGITQSRAHEGDNQGANALIRILKREIYSHEPTPVFGCPLNKEKR